MSRTKLDFVAPSFIVSDVSRTLAFYCDKLGFEIYFQQPETDPFFAIVQRDGVMIFVKAVEGASPRPNASAHPWVTWDAYVSLTDPDALAAEFAESGVPFEKPLGDTTDGLRGFEVRDPDEYVLFFGRPR